MTPRLPFKKVGFEPIGARLSSLTDALRSHPLFDVENLWLHKLQIADKLHAAGELPYVHRSWSRMKPTRRWVIDDLYGAVMKGGKR